MAREDMGERQYKLYRTSLILFFVFAFFLAGGVVACEIQDNPAEEKEALAGVEEQRLVEVTRQEQIKTIERLIQEQGVEPVAARCAVIGPIDQKHQAMCNDVTGNLGGKIEEMESENDDLRDKLAEITSDRDSYRKAADEAKAENEKMEAVVAEKDAEIVSLRGMLSSFIKKENLTKGSVVTDRKGSVVMHNGEKIKVE